MKIILGLSKLKLKNKNLFILGQNKTSLFTLHFEKRNTKYFCDLFLFISAALLTVGFEVAYGGKLQKNLNKVF